MSLKSLLDKHSSSNPLNITTASVVCCTVLLSPLQAESFTYELDSDWNLLGAVEDYNITVFTSDENVKKIWVYREDGWHSEEDLETIQTGEGFWIRTAKSSTIDTTPNNPPVYEGNNMAMSCNYGSSIDLYDKLGSKFSDSDGDDLTITYTTQSESYQYLIDDSRFSCRRDGSFKITATADDGRGGSAMSKTLSVSVYQDSGDDGDSGGGGGGSGGEDTGGQH